MKILQNFVAFSEYMNFKRRKPPIRYVRQSNDVNPGSKKAKQKIKNNLMVQCASVAFKRRLGLFTRVDT